MMNKVGIGARSKWGTMTVRPETKHRLTDIKVPGQSYDGIINELVNMFQIAIENCKTELNTYPIEDRGRAKHGN